MNEALRDKLVCGIRSENIQRKLLTEKDLSWERAFQIATSMELAEGQVKVMGTDIVSVNKVSYARHNQVKKPSSQNPAQLTKSSQLSQDKETDRLTSKPDKSRCARCLRIHWDNNKCPAINWRCFSRNQKGHTTKSALCRNKINEVTEEEHSQEKHEIAVDNFSESGWIREAEETYFLNSLTRLEGNESLRIQLSIEGKPIEMEIDSGACKFVIHIDDFKKIFPDMRIEPVTFHLLVVTGKKVNIVGQVAVIYQ